jgi:hypothetical protein
MKFFRLNLDTNAEYEAIRASVDSQIGFSGSLTCISPYATAPQDQKGRVLLSLTDNQPGYESLLAAFSGLAMVKKAKELTQDEYDASFFPAPSGGGGGVGPIGTVAGRVLVTGDGGEIIALDRGSTLVIEEEALSVDLPVVRDMLADDFAPLGHAHDGSHIIAGTVADARLSNRINCASTLYLWSSFR